jgi:CheY-like chemotaxis protein
MLAQLHRPARQRTLWEEPEVRHRERRFRGTASEGPRPTGTLAEGPFHETLVEATASGPRGEPRSRQKPKPINAVLADDSEFCREFLKKVLGGWPAVRLIAAAKDGLEALKLVDVLKPDLLLLDLHMPGVDGLSATSLIREFHPTTRVIMVTEDDSEGVRETYFAQGADGFVCKRSLPWDLRRAIAELFPKLSWGSEQQEGQTE